MGFRLYDERTHGEGTARASAVLIPMLGRRAYVPKEVSSRVHFGASLSSHCS
jgi:hypothetical protein